MAKKLDQILVIDVESTCWDGAPPPGQKSEIVEIGLCALDVATLEKLEKRSILVRPQRSAISSYCTALTTLTPADVERGLSLDQACRVLKREYHSEQRLWASYGDYDRRQFERDCRSRGAAYPFGPSHLNVKTLFAVTHGLLREVGMARALKVSGLPLEGTHHRGADDAWNIANILSELLRRGRAKGSNE